MKLIGGRIRKVIEGLRCSKAADLSVEAAEEFLRELAAEKDLGNRTYNHYVQAMDEFCRWMVVTRRIPANPLVGTARLNTQVDARHRRRALTPSEVNLLIETARASTKSIQRFDGETRARIYTLAYMTGLHRNELASLTLQSFDLESERPIVTVEARSSCSNSSE